VFATNDACPLCGADAERIDDPVRDAQHFRNCPNCKEYRMTNTFLASIRAWRTGVSDPRMSEGLLKKLSTAARQAIEHGDEMVCITEENAGAVASWTG
jgi:hypothetical protein